MSNRFDIIEDLLAFGHRQFLPVPPVHKLDKQWLGGMVIYTGKEVKPIAEPDIWAVPSHRLFQPFEPAGIK